TILKIVAIGDHKAEKPAKAAAEKKPAARAKETADVTADQHEANEVVGTPTENPAPDEAEAVGAAKPATKKAAPKAKSPSTENAAPAKAAAKKSSKAK